jgi:hypothetical protein
MIFLSTSFEAGKNGSSKLILLFSAKVIDSGRGWERAVWYVDVEEQTEVSVEGGGWEPLAGTRMELGGGGWWRELAGRK